MDARQELGDRPDLLAEEVVGEGFDAVEGKLRLTGWSRTRRVVVLRRRVKSSLAAEASNKGPQQELQFLEPSSKTRLWEYVVLVTNADYSLEAIGQLYRDRADCENGFDELKNQWGWGGYTTHDLERCNLSARAVALIYNWWSWYVRLAHPKARLEAITSRPMLLSGVARLTQHAGQSRLLLTLSHAAGDQIKTMIANIRKGGYVLSEAAGGKPQAVIISTGSEIDLAMKAQAALAAQGINACVVPDLTLSLSPPAAAPETPPPRLRGVPVTDAACLDAACAIDCA